jgi:hypothetical protein
MFEVAVPSETPRTIEGAQDPVTQLASSLDRLETYLFRSQGRSFLVDPPALGDDAPTSRSIQELEAHYWVQDPLDGRLEHRTVRIAQEDLPLDWEEGLSPFLHMVGGVPHLFLTEPSLKDGRIVPGDGGLRVYATHPLVLTSGSDNEDLRFLLQGLVDAHRAAQSALLRLRGTSDRVALASRAAAAPEVPSHPAIAFVGEDDFALFSELQLALGARVRALATVRPTSALLRWWGLGTVRFLGYSCPRSGQGWASPLQDLATEILDLFGRVPGAVVALADLSLLGATSEELGGFLSTVRAAAERWHGHLLVHLSPVSFTPEERERMLEGFQVRHPSPAPGARRLPGLGGESTLPLALTAWGTIPSRGLASGD